MRTHFLTLSASAARTVFGESLDQSFLIATPAGRFALLIPKSPLHNGLLLVLITACAVLTGCKRDFFRRTADRETYGIIGEKGGGPSWRIQPGFTIDPDQRSRFYDPSCRNDPALPIPAPQIHSYPLPPLVTEEAKPRDLEVKTEDDATTKSDTEELPAQYRETNQSSHFNTHGASVVALHSGRMKSAHSLSTRGSVGVNTLKLRSLPQLAASPARSNSSFGLNAVASDPNQVRLAGSLQPVKIDAAPVSLAMLTQEEIDADNENVEGVEAEESLLSDFGQQASLQIPPQPEDAWEQLPAACLQRMLEFEDVRREYVRTFGRPVTEDLLDPAPRVTLENLLELALINNREYQTRKEALYRTALRLTLTRFDFTLRFTRSGNGLNPGYLYRRFDSLEDQRLSVGSGLGIQKSFYTAGDLVARFANDVVLTFGGQNGFTSDISSEIFIDLFQPILQRDIVFEPLIQTERDVVYEARDFVRFRKQLFRDLANSYYALLLRYRRIAISTQDYFSNLDGFNRSTATYQVGRIPRFQVDQFEQNVFGSLSDIVGACNNLESELDRLKVAVGLPPEMPLNLDLSELEALTLSDESTAVREQIRRARVYVQQQIEAKDSSVAIPAAAELARRMLNLANVLEELNEAEPGTQSEMQILVAQLEAEDKRIEAAENSIQPGDIAGGDGPLPAQVFLRNEAVLRILLEAIQRELKLLQLIQQRDADQQEQAAQDEAMLPEVDLSKQLDTSAVDAALQVANLPIALRNRVQIEDLLSAWEELVREYEDLRTRANETPNVEKPLRLPDLIRESELLLDRVDELQLKVIEELRRLGIDMTKNPEDQLRLAAFVVGESDQGQYAATSGLRPLEVDGDDAMLTALVQRLDLMNVRGELADSWRQIKYAGDALRSVLNIRAQQVLARDRFDQALADGVSTRVALEFDAPLNRRIERNVFRLALIDFNVALRNLIAAEDNVKLAIRDDLRDLELSQNQYEIAIASAALAYERVISTRVQLALGQGNITARDFLESQQAYTAALNAVADLHIDYIRARIEFFLNLEQLQVDQLNFWPDLRNEEYPFIPNLDFGGTNPRAYGELPCGPWYSKPLRRMQTVPNGVSYIQNADGSGDNPADKANSNEAEPVTALEAQESANP